MSSAGCGDNIDPSFSTAVGECVCLDTRYVQKVKEKRGSLSYRQSSTFFAAAHVYAPLKFVSVLVCYPFYTLSFSILKLLIICDAFCSRKVLSGFV